VKTFEGIVASAGVALGRAHVWRRHVIDTPAQLRSEDAPREHTRLDSALAKARVQLEALRAQLHDRLGQEHATILDAQLLILEDDEFLRCVREAIDTQQLRAEAAFSRAMSDALVPLDLSGDALFRERMTDFRDVEQRVMRALADRVSTLTGLEEPSILVVSDLTPSETAGLDFEKVMGFCIDGGSDTGHTAIIARSLGVPAVVGVRRASEALCTGDLVALDGDTGRVHADPDPATVGRFEARIRRRALAQERLAELQPLPAVTTDGRRVGLWANIEVPEEIDLAIRNGAEAIGLVRTEYFYFRHESLPTEEEQYLAYREVLEKAKGRPVTFRVLDVGGDKLLAAVGGVRDYNPFLGLRGARFLLANPEILQTQLRALYRASVHGTMRLMFPMICDLTEMLAFEEQAQLAREGLSNGGTAFAGDVSVGIMIETPAAVAMADELAARAGFFSLGTNDLTQYVLAVDRSNLRVSHFACPQHPAVLRAIRDAVRAAERANIPVGSCGDMGSNPVLAILLIGLGVENISASAAAIPALKKAIRSLSFEQARHWAEEATALSTVEDVDVFLRAKAHGLLREFLGPEKGTIAFPKAGEESP
jgi:phosphoenolpyruvate-protein phosphotransferase (PTS system enzyme I)